MVAQRPVEALGDLRVARAVRVRERVPLRRGDATDAGQLRPVDLRYVDELVKAERVQELPQHQRVQLRRVGKAPRPDLLPLGKAVDQVTGQPLDNLGEN